MSLKLLTLDSDEGISCHPENVLHFIECSMKSDIIITFRIKNFADFYVLLSFYPVNTSSCTLGPKPVFISIIDSGRCHPFSLKDSDFNREYLMEKLSIPLDFAEVLSQYMKIVAKQSRIW